jgi:DNA-directed RNA polymerase subunit M/transcription elongation factor TFIIS
MTLCLMDGAEKNKSPTETCEQCGADVKFIVALPRAGGLPTLKVYRCMTCVNVVTESVNRKPRT